MLKKEKGISSNLLKILAVIIMIIDHIGAYMYPKLTQDTYYVLRSIGRIAMPIFAYLLVQGYMYTKNIYKYIFRILLLATITQIILLILGYVNRIYYPDYSRSVNEYLGVLYSYVLSLILLTIIDKKIIINRFNESVNLFFRINIGIVILCIYYLVNIEFDMLVPFIIVELYAIEKIFFKDNKLLLQQVENKLIYKKKIIYCFLILLCLFISTFFVNYEFCQKYVLLIAPVFILLYNGKRGSNNKYIKYVFYTIFPMQHIMLYILGMIFSK